MGHGSGPSSQHGGRVPWCNTASGTTGRAMRRLRGEERRKRRSASLALLAVLLAVSCRPAGTSAPPPLDPGVQEWALPAPPGSAQPDLAPSPDGGLLLSWLEPIGEGELRLQFSHMTLRGDEPPLWTPPRTIARRPDFFRNWADTPHIAALPDGTLWAHWLRSTGPGRMDYGIDLVRSDDGGERWSAPKLVHPAGTRGDHGFVTFWPQGEDRLGLAWLDSRQKAADGHAGHAGHDEGHDHGGAPMMLRAAVYDGAVEESGEWPLDASTCDCCTTSSAVTGRGVVVVYRGRSAGEIRDTRIVRFDGAGWTAPRDVHADGWKIAGCPVNGPAVAARGDAVWVAWYTEAQGVPELRAARSDDAGDTFAAPVTLARGERVLGRVALALDGPHLLAAWLEQPGNGSQRVMLGRFDLHWGQPQVRAAGYLDARGRASGLPRVQVRDGAAWVVWTDVMNGAPVVRGATVR